MHRQMPSPARVAVMPWGPTLAGLIFGVGIGTVFFRKGFSLGRSQSQGKVSGLILPGIMLALTALYLADPQIAGEAKSGVLFYSLKGPGAQHAPFIFSICAGLAVGFLAQRSRFCTMQAVIHENALSSAPKMPNPKNVTAS